MSALQTSLDHRGVATLCLNRPEVHNAFDDALIAELNQALADFAANPQVRLLILCSEGKHFSAGADLAWMRRMAGYSEAENLLDAQALERLMRALYEFPQPTIALIQGAAFGGAVGLVSCCDIALASEEASFALSEVRIGLAPAVISPYVLAAMGTRAAGRYFLSAERFDATQALNLGLIHEIISAAALHQRSEELIATLLANSPEAMRRSKKLLRDIHPVSDESIRRYTTELIASLRVSAEGQEGLTAFLEKRAPHWQKN